MTPCGAETPRARYRGSGWRGAGLSGDPARLPPRTGSLTWWRGRPTMDGNTALGASSPAKPAFTRPEPLSHTRAVVSSSSHMVSDFCKVGKAVETLGVSGGRPRHPERPPSPGAYGHPQPPARRGPEGEEIIMPPGPSFAAGPCAGGRPHGAFLHPGTQGTLSPRVLFLGCRRRPLHTSGVSPRGSMSANPGRNPMSANPAEPNVREPLGDCEGERRRRGKGLGAPPGDEWSIPDPHDTPDSQPRRPWA